MSLCRVLVASFALFVAANPALVRAQQPEPTASPAPAASETKIETIVLIRHGEKPADDEGQLSCQGLNRALALPAVLEKKFGRADFIVAPITAKKPSEHGPAYYYVRPLMTIEPTAIRLGLPVDTKFTFDQIAALQSELCEPSYQRAVIFIAWEHVMAADLVKHLVTSFGGDPQAVPDWPKDDYDSIYIVRLRTDPQGKRSVSFEHDHEGLDGLSTRYPEVNRESAIKN